MRKSALFAFAPVAAAVVIAGRGGSGGGRCRSSTAAGKVGGTAPTIAPSKFGEIQVDSRGRSLYDFVADKLDASTCYGATCASLLPRLTVSGTSKGGPGGLAALLGAPWYVLTRRGAEVTHG